MSKVKAWLNKKKSSDRLMTILLIKGYFIMTLLCFIILNIPFVQKAETSLIDHLFYAVSIVSTTGLAPSTFSEAYNGYGQLISLFFIQLGGVGYMSLSSFILLKQNAKLPKLSARLLRLEFHLPSRYPMLQFLYSVFIFTVIIEIVGAIFLYYGFKNEGVENPLWQAIFHSISAFCTAGFSLFDDSLSGFRDNNFITTTILVLSLLGSIGFIVLMDFFLMLRQKRKKITLTSKIILISTFLICTIPSLLIWVSDDLLFADGINGLQVAFFQNIAAHTTVGFNNFDVGSLSPATLFIMILVMIIGASPSGTGGGIKTTSITAVFAVLSSILGKSKHITFLSKEIPASNIYLAFSSILFYSIILIIGTWLILIIDGDHFNMEVILFESASALSTVGLSTGITGEMSMMSKLVLSFLMFIGRLGVLTFGFAVISESPLLRKLPKIEDIAI